MCENSHSEIKIRIFLTSLVIIGSINWGAYALGYNFVDALSLELNRLFKTRLPFNNIIYIMVAIAALWLAIKRTTWLPFLGNSVLPESLVPLKELEKTDIIIPIKTLPNVKIAYWAALNKGEETPVNLAYGNYENSGVIMSDNKGNAKLPIMTGTGYILPSGEILSRHVHYRIIGYPNLEGMIGKVETVYY